MFRFEIGINVQSAFSPSGKCNTKKLALSYQEHILVLMKATFSAIFWLV
jgi:hypothetical protein